MPDSNPAPDGTWAQVLLKLGEMGQDIAVIKADLKDLPSLSERIRQVELALERGQGGRDLVSRATAIAAVIVALAAAVAVWVAVARR